jgi:hypothetical protein
MNTMTGEDKEMYTEKHEGIIQSNPYSNSRLETENYSLGTMFGAPYRAPISAFWIADFLGGAFLTGASCPAALSISSSKLSEALLPAKTQIHGDD